MTSDAPKTNPEVPTTAEVSTPQAEAAAGAQAKLEADSKPETGTTTTDTTSNGTVPDGDASTAAAAAATGADGADGGDDGDADADKPTLYERTLGRVDTIAEIKDLFGFGKKPTASDLASLPKVQVAEAAVVQGRDAEEKKQEGDQNLDEKSPEEQKSGGIWDAVVWGVKAITPDFIEDGVSTLARAAKESWDWLTDWYDSNGDDLNVDTLNRFSDHVEDRVLTKGTQVTEEQADQLVRSRLPADVTPDKLQRMLEYGLCGTGVDIQYDADTGTWTDIDSKTGTKRVETPDGQVTLTFANGTTIRQDVSGNVSYMFEDGVLKKGADGNYTASFGEWQKEQIAGTLQTREKIEDGVAASESDNVKAQGRRVRSEQEAREILADRILAGHSIDGQQLTPEQVREMLRNGLPGATTEVISREGPEKGSKVQELPNGIKRIESADGKTVTLQLGDGTTVTQNADGTTWHRLRDGKPEILTESADGRHRRYAYDQRTSAGVGDAESGRVGQEIDSTTNKKVLEQIREKYEELTRDRDDGSPGMSHEEAMEVIARDQFIGGARQDGEVNDGNRRTGFIQQIDGKWYQVNSNGREIHLREVTVTDSGLDFGAQFRWDPNTRQFLGTDGQPFAGTPPAFRVLDNGQVVIGQNGGLTLESNGNGITGNLHRLIANGDGTSVIASKNENGDWIETEVVPGEVRTQLGTGGLRPRVREEATIDPQGRIDSNLPDTGGRFRFDPIANTAVTPQIEVASNGDVRVPGLGGITFRQNGDILASDGGKLYDGSTGQWSSDSGIIGCGGSSSFQRAEAARIESQAQATSARVQSIGCMALSIARSGNPNALGIMRHLAWAGISMADAGMSAAGGHVPAMISLSLARGVAITALGVTNDQSRALAEVTRLGIFDSTTQKQAMIAGSLGSTFITPESAALHFAQGRRPHLQSVA